MSRIMYQTIIVSPYCSDRELWLLWAGSCSDRSTWLISGLPPWVKRDSKIWLEMHFREIKKPFASCKIETTGVRKNEKKRASCKMEPEFWLVVEWKQQADKERGNRGHDTQPAPTCLRCSACQCQHPHLTTGGAHHNGSLPDGDTKWCINRRKSFLCDW